MKKSVVKVFMPLLLVAALSLSAFATEAPIAGAVGEEEPAEIVTESAVSQDEALAQFLAEHPEVNAEDVIILPQETTEITMRALSYSGKYDIQIVPDGDPSLAASEDSESIVMETYELWELLKSGTPFRVPESLADVDLFAYTSEQR